MLASGLNFGLSMHLQPYFVYASSEELGESAHMRRLAWAFVARKYDEYQNCHVLARILLLDILRGFPMSGIQQASFLMFLI